MLSLKVNNLFNISLISIVFLLLINKVKSRAKKCYVCRSRGPLGDCKDPFEFNSTTVQQSGVETPFCASGWCGKSIEGESEGQHLMATERMCLQRPPSDNKERCAQTYYGNKKKSFFMCFCKGDLCNTGQLTNNSFTNTLICFLTYFYLLSKLF